MQTNLMIKEIENKYPVEDITASGIPVWQFLRNMYAYELDQKHCPYSDLKKIRGVNYVKNALINYYWGKHNLVKHFSAVLFTSSVVMPAFKVFPISLIISAATLPKACICF